MEGNKKWGRLLKAVRQEQGLTQKELSEFIQCQEISQGLISAYETGRKLPAEDIEEELIDLFEYLPPSDRTQFQRGKVEITNDLDKIMDKEDLNDVDLADKTLMSRTTIRRLRTTEDPSCSKPNFILLKNALKVREEVLERGNGIEYQGRLDYIENLEERVKELESKIDNLGILDVIF